MRRVLEDEDYQVALLQNGLDALDQVRSQLPDLLILDLKLGEISGQDVLKALKQDPVTQEIPVIVYTAAVLEAEEVSQLIKANRPYTRMSGLCKSRSTWMVCLTWLARCSSNQQIDHRMSWSLFDKIFVQSSFC